MAVTLSIHNIGTEDTTREDFADVVAARQALVDRFGAEQLRTSSAIGDLYASGTIGFNERVFQASKVWAIRPAPAVL